MCRADGADPTNDSDRAESGRVTAVAWEAVYDIQPPQGTACGGIRSAELELSCVLFAHGVC
jgi:hypothetical protein